MERLNQFIRQWQNHIRSVSFSVAVRSICDKTRGHSSYIVYPVAKDKWAILHTNHGVANDAFAECESFGKAIALVDTIVAFHTGTYRVDVYFVEPGCVEPYLLLRKRPNRRGIIRNPLPNVENIKWDDQIS